MDYCVLLLGIMVWPLTGAVGQSTALDELIACVEQQYGPDNLLINGRSYQPVNLRAEGHPYFQTATWQPGVVYLNGQPFTAQKLNYNLERQQLAIQYDRPNGTYQKAVVSPLLLDSFRIGKHRFINYRLIAPGQDEVRYLEKIFEGELAFYRYQKKVLTAPSSSTPYGKYSGLRDVYYLLRGGQAYRVTKRRDFLACFPEHKSQVKKYMKKHLPRWKKMTGPQFVELLKFCYDQI